MKELFSITVFLVAGLLFSFLSQQEALASPNHSSASFSSSSYETFDGTDMGISFQYPYNWVKFEAGFDQGVLNDFEGVVSFDIVNDNDHLRQGNDVPIGDSGLVNPNLSVVSLRSPYHNLTLRQYAEIRTFDFIQFFLIMISVSRKTASQMKILMGILIGSLTIPLLSMTKPKDTERRSG